jgi:hypothetical protein
MILNEFVKIKLNGKTKKYYEERGYLFINNETNVKIEDLSINSNVIINCKCDICCKEKKIKYQKYIKNISNMNIYTCSSKCSTIKKQNTLLKNYGVDNPSKNSNIQEKRKERFIENYGVDNPMKNILVKKRVKERFIENYGVDNPMKNEIIKNKTSYTKNNKFKDYFNSYNYGDEYKFISYNKKLTLKHIICGEIFEISAHSLHDRKNTKIFCNICNINNNISLSEKEICGWLKELNSTFKENDRETLEGRELDIYIPSYNLAIEFNGLYWHSELYKDKNYHLEKSLKCQEKGVQLLHIWEDEWVYKQEIVKSIILNKLELIKERIYARQCEIRVVEDSKLVREFLDKNHIQGYSQSSIKLGLYYKNELVSLMTFGYRHTNAKKEFELIRFCNRINLNVIGSASKLFNYFKQNYHFTELISYSDFRLFDGSMYQTLGFTKQHLSKPDYFWCKDIERKHRFNFNKQKLIKEGFDGSKTEVDIMHERGYFRVFGCGQYRWIYHK